MKVLIIGSGGREHALAWAVAQSPLLKKLYVAPGNSGTASLAENIELDINNFSQLTNFCCEKKIDLLVAGPENPIVNGLYDYFQTDPCVHQTAVLAPSAAAARLEGSKDFAKQFMKKYGIPTAAYRTFTKSQLREAKDYILKMGAPIVVKADGLAAGKGVTVATDTNTALSALDDVFVDEKFGDAGSKVVIEECLMGIEISVFVLTDGKNYVLLPEAKDYKRIGEGDTGPNTGGMGAVSPVPFADEAFMKKVKERIIEPTIEGLQAEKADYYGFIFFGLMNVKGDPYVIEYNVRMGDPEAEVVIPRVKTDLLELMLDTARGNLGNRKIELVPDFATTVMLVSKGYPGSYEKGKEISFTEENADSIIFHAGAKTSRSGLETSGGRVMGVTSLAPTLDGALRKSYHTAEGIEFDGKTFRGDIGRDLLNLING